MNSFIHRAKDIFNKQLLTLVLACAMLISAAPLQAMALEEQPEQAAELPETVNPAEAQTDAGNWGFESGDLRGWTVLTPGWGTDEQGKSTGVVSTVSEGESEVPTNQSGSYHLSGLYNGIPGVEGWAVRSSSFVLGGSGWISVKMGGAAAAVKVFLADGTQVGYYRQSRYNDTNYPYLSKGGAWHDMATYAIDLSKYLGKEMYLVLCDEVVGGSAHAVFDDVVTNYDAAPDVASRYDTVMDGHKKGETASQVRIPWVKASNSYKPCTEKNVQNGGFESGDLTGWTVLTEGFNATSAVVNERTYWAQELPYNQSGSYHLNGWNTGISEEKGWAVRSSTFVLRGSGFISVKMGGNAAVAKVFLADGTQVGYYRNFRFHDTNFPYISKGGSWCDMATYVIDLSDYLGREMYIELHDEVITDGWANAFFDEVVTYYETAPDASKHSDKAPDGHNPGESPRLTYIPWVSVPKTSTEYANQIPNGDFETGNLSGWTIYGSGFPIKDGLPAADSAVTYWNQELPFNKSGNYFVNGSALSGNEASTWRLRSTPFTLSGSGWISVKMGGHAAAVRVYKLDGTLVGDFDQSRFCDKDFPYLSKGGSWNDMATYLLDLTQNIGDVLYIELCDDPIVGGWANAFFDDVVTYYETVPTGKTETVKDGHQPGEKPKTVKIEPVVPLNNLYNPRNGGFEMGNLTGWTVIAADNFKPHTAVLPIKDYNLDTDTQIRKLPYNNSGNYMLSGHDAVGGDNEEYNLMTWTLRSSPFTLAGSGYISVKMGGHAAAFQVRSVKDNKIVAYCEQRRFSDVDFPYLSKGGSWRDMGTYVMDLSSLLGEKLVIELMDVDVGTHSWAQAYFDEVICYYPQRPTTKSDTVIDGYVEGDGEPKEIEIPWIYLDGHDNDTLNRFPIVPDLKDVTGGTTASGSTSVTKPDGTTEEITTETVNLYDYFKTQQGLPDYQFDGSKLTFTKVTRYESGGASSGIIADYSKLTMKAGSCYVVDYKFEQGGVAQTGSFSIMVSTEETPKEVFNGGFETGNLAGWTVVEGNGFNTSGAVISDETYWDEKLPYNQKGNFHLDGFPTHTGIPEPDSWAVRSSTFELGGIGCITWRMGGRAASLSVHLADSGKEIIRVRQSQNIDPGGEPNPFPDVSKAHWADMSTYVLNLEDFVGEKLYVELHDEKGDGNWRNAFFDEVVTYYDSPLDWNKQFDTVDNSIGCSETSVKLPWKVVDEKPTAFVFEQEPDDENRKVTEAAPQTNVNLVDILNKQTVVTYKGQKAEPKITEVKFNGSKVRTRSDPDYEAYDMSEPGTYKIFYKAIYNELESPEKSFTVRTYDKYTLLNGGFEIGDLTGWKVINGNNFNTSEAVISAKTYWGEQLPYNQAGDYHLDGWATGVAEGDTWTVRSDTFTLGGEGYISVRMGGNAAAVRVYNADGTLVGYYKQTRFSDTGYPNVRCGSWADMGTYVIDLRAHKNEELYIELCDEAVSGWAQAFFDEVVTYYEIAPDWENSFETVQNSIGWSPDEVRISWRLAENQKDGASIPAPAPDGAQVTNGSFEDGFTGWTSLTNGFNTETAVISAATYWTEGLPYNQAGDKHLDGWATGIDEADSWAIKSSKFKLAGTGYISVRMGGNAAAVRVYKADGTLVGYYKQNRFSDTGYPNVKNGSWADMGTYMMDLHEYIGQELYIVLCDEGGGNWAHAFFDEVVTYYATVPNWEQKCDVVSNSKDNDPENVGIYWQLAENRKDEEPPALDLTPATQADEIEVYSVAEDAEIDAEETPDAGEAEADADAEPTPEESAEPETPTVPEVPVPEEPDKNEKPDEPEESDEAEGSTEPEKPDETEETVESGEETVDDEE